MESTVNIGKSGADPHQHEGVETIVRHEESPGDEFQARKLFRQAVHRLCNVSDWNRIVKGASADFNLMDTNCKRVNRPVEEGDYFQIDIPGPGSVPGRGYDWVRVEEIKEGADDENQVEYVYIRVRPSPDPRNPDPATAHFFDTSATSTFTVRREGLTVYAEVHGRNEKPNTRSGGFIAALRNFVVAVGAMLGLSRPQWSGLAKGLLAK